MSEVAKENRLVRRGAVYYFRARVPQDLVDAFGRREVKTSLKTSDHSKALKDVRVHSVKFDADCEAYRRARAPGYDDGVQLQDLSDEEIQRIVVRWFAEQASRRESDVPAASMSPDGAEEAEFNVREDLAETAAGVSDAQAMLGSQVENVLLAAAVRSVGEQRTSIGFRRVQPRRRLSDEDRASAKFEFARELFRRASHELAHRAQDRLQGDYSGRVHDALWSEGATTAARSQGTSVRLKAIAEQFLSDPEHDGWANKTRRDYASTLRTLMDLLTPERDMSLFTAEDSQRLLDELSSLPRNARQRFPGKSLRVILSDAGHASFPCAGAANVNKHMALLSTVLRYAARRGLVAHSVRNDARIRTSKKSRVRRDPFSKDELQQIFHDPDFVEWAKSTAPSARPSDYFIPVIAMHLGMRLGEICQLECSDIKDRDGILVIDINDQSDDADFERIKSVKTSSSVRMIPIVPTHLGGLLLARAQLHSSRGEHRLFPDVAVASDGTLSSSFSKRFGRRLKRLGITAERNGFHRFRHSFRDACRDAGIEASVIDALGGWKSHGVGSSYGAGFSVKRLFLELCKVDYGIEIPGLSYKGE